MSNLPQCLFFSVLCVSVCCVFYYGLDKLVQPASETEGLCGTNQFVCWCARKTDQIRPKWTKWPKVSKILKNDQKRFLKKTRSVQYSLNVSRIVQKQIKLLGNGQPKVSKRIQNGPKESRCDKSDQKGSTRIKTDQKRPNGIWIWTSSIIQENREERLQRNATRIIDKTIHHMKNLC